LTRWSGLPYVGLMSELTEKATAEIIRAGKQAQYASKLVSMTDAQAFAILRQLRVTVEDTQTRGDVPPARMGNGTGTGRTVSMATDKQIAYINALRAKLGRSPLHAGTVRKSEASMMIEDLKADIGNEEGQREWDATHRRTYDGPLVSAAQRTQDMRQLDSGMYALDGKIYRVQLNRAGTQWYAKELTASGLEYAGKVRGLTADHRMTLDDAKAYGRETGQCCCCGALLTDPKSVAAGIGPICGGKV
jgi:Family of unknown function (DUF6011)